ncbi:MAG: hypothetical protein J6W84_06175 [Bacteroidales bacterium]|nr:hypothetical protein [Bacteroidales bacterium]
MPQSVDGDIRLSASFKFDTESVKRQAQNVKKRLKDILDSGAAKGNPQLEKMELQLQKSGSQIEKLQKKLRELENTKVPTDEYKKLEDELKTLADKSEELSRKLSDDFVNQPGMEKYREKLNAEFDKVIDKIEQVENKKRELEESGGAFKFADSEQVSNITTQLSFATQKGEQLANKFDQISGNTQQAAAGTAKLSNFVKGAGAAAGKFSKVMMVASIAISGIKKGIQLTISAIRTFKNIGVKAFNAVKKAISSVKSAIEKVKSAFSKLKSKIKDTFGSSNKSIKHGLKMLIKYGLGVRGLFALFRKLRGYASDAFQNLAQQSSSFNKTMSNITNTFSQFKNSLATALQPIITIVEPIIIRILNLFINAANAVGSFFATLTGQKYIYKAIKPAESYAESIEDTGNAAKKAAKQLAEYDKLVVIQSQDAADAASAAGGGAAFTEELIDPSSSVADFARALREAWENEDFEAIGQLIGEKINSIVSKIDEAVKWDNVGEKITTFIDNTSRAFNSLIDTIDWPLIGQTIGDGLNTITYTIETFIDKFDISELGTKFALAFNSLNDTVDWEAIGRTFSKGLKEITDTINNFVDNTEWEKFGSNIATAFDSLAENFDAESFGKAVAAPIQVVTETLDGFLKKFDENGTWDKLGKKIGTTISSWFNAIDWNTIGSNLSSATNGIATTIISMFDSVNWTEMGSTLATGFDTLISGIDGEKIGTALAAPIESINQSLNGFLQQFKENGTWSTAGTKIAQVINSWFSGINWKTIRENITLSIDGIIQSIESLFDETRWSDIGYDLSEIVNGFLNVDWSNVGETIGKGIAGALNTVTSFLDGVDFQKLGKDVVDLILGIDWKAIFKSAGSLLSTALTSALDIVIGLVKEFDFADFLSTLVGSILGFVGSINWSGLVSKLSELLGALVSKLLTAPFNVGVDIGNFVINLIGKIKDWFEDKKSEWDEAGISIWEGIFQGIWNGIKNIGKWIKENIFDPFIQGFKDAFGIHSPSTVMAEMGGYLLDGLKQGLGNLWEAVKGKFTDLLNGIKSWFSDKKQDLIDAWNGFKDGIGNITATIKGKIDETFDRAREAWNGIKDKVSTLTAEAKEKVTGAIQKLKDGWEIVKDKTATLLAEAKEKTAGAIQTIKNAWDSIKDKTVQLVANVIDGVKNGIGVGIEKLKSGWEFVKDKTATLTAYAKEGASAIFDKVKSGWEIIKDKTATLTTGIKETASGAFDKIKSGWESIKDRTATLTTNVKETATGIFDKIKSGWDVIKDKTATITTGIKEATTGTFDKVKSGWDAIKDKVATLTTKVEQTKDNAFSEVQKGWDAIKDKTVSLKASYDTAKETVSGWWSKTKKWFNGGDENTDRSFSIGGTFEAAKSTVSGWWTKTKDWFNGGNGGESKDNRKFNVGAAFGATQKGVSAWWTDKVQKWWGDKKRLGVGAKQTTTKQDIKDWWQAIKDKWATKSLKVQGEMEVDKINFTKPAQQQLATVATYSSGQVKTNYTAAVAASGGLFNTGQLILAREAGPELIGTIGSKTAVVNNRQIIAGIARAVYSANREQSILLRRQNALTRVQTTAIRNQQLGQVKIPHLAKGSVIPPNRQFLAMLGDQRSGTNVEAPLSTIEQALQNVLNRMSGTNAPIILQLDGKQIAKVVWSESDKRYKQTGKAYA